MSAVDIFKNQGVTTGTHVTTYAVELQVRNVIVGGVPASPNVIRKWLESRLAVRDEALEEMLQRTLKERFANETPSLEQQIEALMEDPEGPTINGFKRDAVTGELVYEGRCMKAALKEFANSAYPGTDWPGKEKVSKGFRKGLMNTGAERIFVPETYIGLGVKEPDRVEERIKHVMTPQGPKSAINRVEIVEQPRLSFHVRVHDDFLPQEAWARIWERGEDIGIGADRGRSDGQFDLVKWEKIN